MKWVLLTYFGFKVNINQLIRDLGRTEMRKEPTANEQGIQRYIAKKEFHGMSRGLRFSESLVEGKVESGM